MLFINNLINGAHLKKKVVCLKYILFSHLVLLSGFHQVCTRMLY